MHKIQKMILTSALCLLLGAILVACTSAAPTTTQNSAAAHPAISPTPGIGVPVSSGNWQVVLTAAHKTNQWYSYTARSGFLFLVLDITFKNLDSAQKTTVAAKNIIVMNTSGKSYSSSGFATDSGSNVDTINGLSMSGITGFTCVCQPTFSSKGNTMHVTVVFVLDESSANPPLKLQFQSGTIIPFSAKGG